MSHKTNHLDEEQTVYDLNEIKKHSDYPVRVVCDAIKTVIKPMIEDPEKLAIVYWGVKEAIKDAEEHGSESDPRLIIVCKKLGEMTIDIIDRPKEQSEHNGFGGQIRKAAFGEDYSATVEDGLYREHLIVRCEDMSQESAKIKHAA
ncbi:MAG: hypothetical protein WCP03_02720 [Candidatus Saccharibacteria bacterium]